MKMKAIYLSEWEGDFQRVYSAKIKEEIAKLFDIEDKCLSGKDILTGNYQDAEVIFSTWIMPELSLEEIKKYLPNVKHVFYAAGSVKTFAKPFLDHGAHVYSAWQANAIPVVEVAVAEILLATKGFYQCLAKTKKNFDASKEENQTRYPGNYDVNVGLLGYGAIGRRVAAELRRHDLNVYVFANDLTEKEAEEKGLHAASLEEIFEKCQVVSNHLPDIPELYGVIDGHLFKKMGPYSTFLNTARGREVDEAALIKKAKEDGTFYAVLDVTYPEPPLPESEFFKLDNIVLTPHFAGSMGKEVIRMSEYMLNEAKKILAGEQPQYEVTAAMLERMA